VPAITDIPDQSMSLHGDIMIVDDNPANLKLLEDMLLQQGHEVRSFPLGRLALAAAIKTPPDLILLDINMPEMDGYEVCAHLKSTQQLSDIPVIFLSALNETQDKVKAFHSGAVDYVSKPFQFEEVHARVETHLKLHHLQRAMKLHNERLEELVNQRTEQLQVALKRIESTYDQTLQALGGALDLRDNETAGHSQRVTRYSLEIAQAMGCDEEELRQIALGAYLHDVGKIGIPDAILLKAGKLNPEETEVMRQHVHIGYDMVSRISFLSRAAQIVLTHQEFYDGRGYPQGLIGKEIPLGARIFSVADTLDAMTSDRPYRAALPFQTAREEIVRCSGTQFDPDVVQAFLSIPEHVWKRIRVEVDSGSQQLKLTRVVLVHN
jgi:putative nucleotidyltransferase with HDIG domain